MSVAKGKAEKYAAVAVEEPTAEAVCISNAGERAAAPVLLVAPSNLPGGYEFAAYVNGETVTVKVPLAGVSQGETFTASIVQPSSSSHNVPTGRWRDSNLDCFANGICNSMLWCACCCHAIALGQVMTRMKLDLCGKETSRIAYWNPFKVLMAMSLGMFLLHYVINRLIWTYTTFGIDENGNFAIQGPPFMVTVLQYVQVFLRIALFLYVLLLRIRTRAHIRNKYQIPVRSCGRYGDCCNAFWLPCCTVAHMARHTADYDTYHASCCDDTGLSPLAPCVV